MIYFGKKLIESLDFQTESKRENNFYFILFWIFFGLAFLLSLKISSQVGMVGTLSSSWPVHKSHPRLRLSPPAARPSYSRRRFNTYPNMHWKHWNIITYLHTHFTVGYPGITYLSCGPKGSCVRTFLTWTKKKKTLAPEIIIKGRLGTVCIYLRRSAN